jgi:sortase (surface protein transpeptidase)
MSSPTKKKSKKTSSKKATSNKKTVSRKNANSRKKAANSKVTRSSISNLFIVIAIGLLVIGTGISWRDWHANALASSQAAKLISDANHNFKRVGTSSLTATAPSTIKPTADTISSYQVPPDSPRYLTIPKLGVYARVLSVGLTSQGALSTPGDVYDTAWYNQSAKPGQPGAILIDGHISSWTTNGVFYNLKSLLPGDQIKVERGDGSMFNYKVAKVQTYSADNVNMTEVVNPIDPSSPGLNLISCSGDVIPGTNEFSERIVVFASQT